MPPSTRVSSPRRTLIGPGLSTDATRTGKNNPLSESFKPDGGLPRNGIRWLGWLIHGVLLVLMAVGLAGPFVAYFGLRQWLRIRRIERWANEGKGQPNEDRVKQTSGPRPA